MFEMRERSGMGRIGRLQTNHGVVETPALMPVVNPSDLIVKPGEMMKRFGVQVVITNAYILQRGPLAEKTLKEGVHRLLGFKGPIMTDSGAFQQHVYGQVETSNKEIVEFQKAIGADLGTALDIFSEPDTSREKAQAAVKETVRRCREAGGPSEKMGLVGTVQGGLFSDLRTMCAQELSDLPLTIHAVGGVVPLLEAYRFSDLVEVIVASKKGLRPDRPVHLFGAGHPLTFGLAVLLGCDLFDSASYAKYANDGRMITQWGTVHVEDVGRLTCTCPSCNDATVRDLQGDVGRLAAHNLHVSLQEIEEVKEAIHQGSLWEHVERRCRAHPHLLDGLKVLRAHVEFLERYEKLSESNMFYTGPESIWRPSAWRFRRRVLTRYRPPAASSLLILPSSLRPRSRVYEGILRDLFSRAKAHALVKSPLGPVPVELDGVNPVGQSLLPAELDVGALEAAEVFLHEFLRIGHFTQGLLWEGRETIDHLAQESPGPSELEMDIARARAVADYQFGPGAADCLFAGEVKLVKSRRTGSIRNVLVDGDHLLSLRAGDGLYTLKIAGGRRLHQGFPSPALRVVVDQDSAPFNLEGDNVFAKFVLECDPEIRPWDEVLVVDEEDQLLAVGRTLMNREEMLAFLRGVAVRVREGSSSKHLLGDGDAG